MNLKNHLDKLWPCLVYILINHVASHIDSEETGLTNETPKDRLPLLLNNGDRPVAAACAKHLLERKSLFDPEFAGVIYLLIREEHIQTGENINIHFVQGQIDVCAEIYDKMWHDEGTARKLRSWSQS